MITEYFIPESPKESTEVISEEEMLKYICPLTFENFENNEEINLDKVYYLNDSNPRNIQVDNKTKQNKESLNAVFLIDDFESVFNKLGSNEENQENQENKIISCYNDSTDSIQSYEKDDYDIPFFVKNVVSENNYFYPIKNENLELVIKVEQTSQKNKYKKSENSLKKKENKKNEVKTAEKEKIEPKIFKKKEKRGPYKKKQKFVEKINTQDKCFPFSTGKGILNYAYPMMQLNSNINSLDFSVLEEYYNRNEIDNQNGFEYNNKSKKEEELETEKIEESLYLNEQMSSTNNFALWKFTTKKYFIDINGKKKRVKKKRKYKPDDIRKKIKARFHKIIKNIINENLKKAGSVELFDFIPQSFIGNVSKKVNSKALELTYKEILSSNFYFEINNESLDNKVDILKFKKNLKVLKYLEENPEISERAGFDIVQKMKYKELLNIYFKSAQFENSINQLKAENESNEYIEEYIYRAKTYLKFYCNFENEQTKKKDLSEK